MAVKSRQRPDAARDLITNHRYRIWPTATVVEARPSASPGAVLLAVTHFGSAEVPKLWGEGVAFDFL